MNARKKGLVGFACVALAGMAFSAPSANAAVSVSPSDNATGLTMNIKGGPEASKMFIYYAGYRNNETGASYKRVGVMVDTSTSVSVIRGGGGVWKSKCDPIRENGTSGKVVGALCEAASNAGNPTIMVTGGGGADVIWNNTHYNSTMFGEAGNDTLWGGKGVDQLNGGGDGDTINGDAGGNGPPSSDVLLVETGSTRSPATTT